MNRIRMGDEPLISELADDAELVPLVEWYISELPERAAAVQAACLVQDLESAGQLALALLESAGGYGFPSIGEVARRIEDIARSRRRLDDLPEDCAQLINLCNRARVTNSHG